MRSRYFIIIHGLIATLLCLPLTATAQDGPLSCLIPLEGSELETAFSGKTMDGIYKTPRERSGTHKFTESFNADGSTDYFEGPLVDKGEWLVRGRLICFRYSGSLSGGVSCFTVFQTGTCLYSYNPANIGRDGYPLNDNLWSAKTIIRGDISTCDDLSS